MSKIDINALRYLVMEGGGARGTIYLGAIRALERELIKKQENDTPGAEGSIWLASEKKNPAIMDFVTGDEGEELTYVRGVGGGSAGAVVAFSIALGLNSEEAEKALGFDFEKFLSEADPGKYRMVNDKSQLMVGEDLKKEIGNASRSKPFEYDLNDRKTNVIGDVKKRIKRAAVVNLAISSVIDGVVQTGSKIIDGIGRIFKGKNADPVLERVYNFFENVEDKTLPKIIKFGYKPLIKTGLKIWAKKALGFKVNEQVIASALLDRGLFSGFQVREFFYDLILFAATRDTHFQRSMIKYYNENKLDGISEELEASDFNYENFTIGDRIGEKTGTPKEFTGKAKIVLEHLQHITFAEFFNITKVKYCAAASNFTTSSPMYFSDDYTPHFRVLECTGASMSIPPALRPVFNDSDAVLEPMNDKFNAVQLPVSRNKNYPLSVTVNGQQKNFVGSTGKFSRSDYELYEYAVKKALQLDFAKPSDENNASAAGAESIYIDLNNVIDINTFLPKMQRILVGEREATDNIFARRSMTDFTSETVTVNGLAIKVDLDLLRFFYNAQYKGLLFDGGYIHNIPYNYFRNSDSRELDGVLAIKLDNNFPTTFKLPIYNAIDRHLASQKLSKELVVEQMAKNSWKIMSALLSDEKDVGKLLKSLRFELPYRQTYKELESIVRKQFDFYFEDQAEFLDQFLQNKHPKIYERDRILKRELTKRQKRIDNRAINAFIDEWVKDFEADNFIKPWAKNKSILAAGFEGYFYGAERGQIRSITDHDHILPLYDYGVGTYDFDLDKVRPMEKVAQNEAEIAVGLYFSEN